LTQYPGGLAMPRPIIVGMTAASPICSIHPGPE
jgi:hypothetical protein